MEICFNHHLIRKIKIWCIILHFKHDPRILEKMFYYYYYYKIASNNPLYLRNDGEFWKTVCDLFNFLC